MIRALFRDTRGHSTTNMLSMTLTWFTTMFVFLMNVQLGQLFYRRDVVDHATAVASDDLLPEGRELLGGGGRGEKRDPGALGHGGPLELSAAGEGEWRRRWLDADRDLAVV